MTAATAGQPTKTRNLGAVKRFLMKTSETVYANAKVMLNTSGTAEAAADGTTGLAVIGIAEKTVTSAASGATWINVQEAEALFVGATLEQADVGRMMYSTDDLTFDETPPINNLPCGPLVEYVGASSGWVWLSWKNLPILVANKVRHHVPVFQGLLATIADGDMLTDWTPGFVGEIVGLFANTNVAASTASKAADLNVDVGATPTTGGVLGLTTAGLDTIGKVVTSTAITAGGIFTAANTLSVIADNTVAFGEGEATISMILDQYLGA